MGHFSGKKTTHTTKKKFVRKLVAILFSPHDHILPQQTISAPQKIARKMLYVDDTRVIFRAKKFFCHGSPYQKTTKNNDTTRNVQVYDDYKHI